MTTRLRVMLATIGLLIAAAMVPLTSTTAQAASGWTGQRCYNDTGNNAYVCAQHYYRDNGNNYTVTQVYLCAYRKSGYYNGFTATANSTWRVFGSNGDFKGSGNLDDVQNVGTSVKCTISNAGATAGGGSCVTVAGTLVLNNWPNANYAIHTKMTGGAC